MVDYLLSILYISIAGFLLVKVGLNDSTSLSKHLTLYIGFLINPLWFCIGGHMIFDEGDKLHTSIYNNKWYELIPKDRKSLFLPSIVATEGLSWKYKRIARFDMATYLFIVRQSYSFIAFLKLMG